MIPANGMDLPRHFTFLINFALLTAECIAIYTPNSMKSIPTTIKRIATPLIDGAVYNPITEMISTIPPPKVSVRGYLF